MAGKRGVRVTLLVEDRMIERFARRVLVRLGFHDRELRIEPYPSGRGSAKQWVDKQYARLVRVHRSKSYQKGLAIVVGTDADELTLNQRSLQLAACLEAEKLDPRQAKESIVHWIPKWNIETWILALLGESIDEDQNYKDRVQSPPLDQVARARSEIHFSRERLSKKWSPGIEDGSS